MGFKKLPNLALNYITNLLLPTIQKKFSVFSLSDFPPATQTKTVTTSTLANLAVNLDRNCSFVEDVLIAEHKKDKKCWAVALHIRTHGA